MKSFVLAIILTATVALNAQENAGTLPGNQQLVNTETVKDYDGNIYNTVAIGTQTWMKENLKTTHYRNGDAIPTTYPATRDISDEEEPKYQWSFGGSEVNASVYGLLYTWYVVNDPRQLCPDGWHVPSNQEWETMLNFLGQHSVAGGKLKETGFSHWNEPNTAATNESGFSALPGAGRLTDGSFRNLGEFGSWWTSSGSGIGAQYWYIEHDAPNAFRTYIYQSRIFGFSVRCIKD